MNFIKKTLCCLVVFAMMFSMMNVTVFADNTVAKIGNNYYTTIQAAVDAAKTGDTVTVIGNVSNEAVSVSKDITITGTTTLNNVSVNAVEGCTSLTVNGLNFTGNSWINSGAASSLTVSYVTANVTPNNGSYTNSSSAFIALGKNESKELDLKVENSNIVTSSRTSGIIGWAKIKKADIIGNTFGSETAYQTYGNSAKFMAVKEDAVFTIKENTVYSNYNGFVFYQNTTRDNAYTAYILENTFYGNADHIWIEIPSQYNTNHAKILVSSNNTVNGNALTEKDIKYYDVIKNWTGYVGVDVTLDETGKITGGTFINDVTNHVAQGFEVKLNSDGTYNTIKVVTGLEGEGTEENPYLINNLDELKWFRDQVDKCDQNGSTQFEGKFFKLTSDINLDEDGDGIGENWNPIGTMSSDKGSFKGVFDGDNHTISNLYIESTEAKGIGLFSRTVNKAQIKNLTINNVTIKASKSSTHIGAVVGNSYASTKLTNVHVTGKIDIYGKAYIGGISGHGYVVMDNCSVKAEGIIKGEMWCIGGILGYAGEGSTNIMNSSVEATGNGLVLTSAAGGIGAIVGMAEDNDGKQPISGSNLSAKNVDIKTFVGGYGTAYSDYALGYLYGGNKTSILTGTLEVDDVTFETNKGATNPPIVDAIATVGTKVFFSLQDALNAAEDGDTVTLLRDVKLKESVVFDKEGTFTLDGNGKTITQAAGYKDTQNGLIMLGNTLNNDASANTRKYTVKNVVFDGIEGYSVIRSQGVDLTFDNNTVQNCNQTLGTSLLRFDITKTTMTNCTVKDNTATIVFSHNWNGDSNLPLYMDECSFENNTATSTAVVYYVKGSSCTITNSEFTKNNITASGNAATVYLGFMENCTVKNCLFVENSVESKGDSTRVSGGIFFGYDAVIEDNVFVNNSAKNTNNDALGNDICTSVYYGNVDLSKNYWGGNEPQEDVNYLVQHKTSTVETKGELELDSYYKQYTTDENGNVVTSELVEIADLPYIFGLAFHIINMDRPDENNYQVGIFAGIDSLDYAKVGFKIFDEQGNLLGEKATTRVYDSITAGGTTITAKEYNIHSIFGMSIHFDEYWDNKAIRYQPFAVDYSGEEIPGYIYEIEDIYTK